MLVIADRSGGLGNRLWTMANVIAWALEHDRSVASPGFTEFASHFPALRGRHRVPGVTAEKDAAPRVCDLLSASAWSLLYRINLRTRTLPILTVPDHEMIDLEGAPAERVLLGSRLTFLTGLYLLAPRSLRAHRDEVRRLLTVDPVARTKAEDVLAGARAGAGVVVGVHIRQGDYRTFCDGLMYYESEEYARLMDRLRSLWPGRRVAFVVCSDEPQPQSLFKGLDIHFGPGDRYGDLHALALCDYIVGPSSTFSRWASFWGQAPLWMMDWRSAERQGAPASRTPDPADFAVAGSATHLVDLGLLPERKIE